MSGQEEERKMPPGEGETQVSQTQTQVHVLVPVMPLDKARDLKQQGNEAYKRGVQGNDKDKDGDGDGDGFREAVEKYTKAFDILDNEYASSTCEKAELNRVKAECLCNRSLVKLLQAKQKHRKAKEKGAGQGKGEGEGEGEGEKDVMTEEVKAEFERSLDDASEAANLDPTYAKAYLRKAAAYEALGRHKEAKAAKVSGKRREINARKEQQSRVVEEDNVMFLDLLGREQRTRKIDGFIVNDPLDLILKSGGKKLMHIPSPTYHEDGSYAASLLVTEPKDLDKALNKVKRRGEMKLFFACSLRAVVCYLKGNLDFKRNILSQGEETKDGCRHLLQSLREAYHRFHVAVQHAVEAGKQDLALRFYRVCMSSFEAAFEDVKEYWKVDPDERNLSALYCNIGLIHRNMSHPEEAIQYFEKSSEYGNGDAIVEVGLIHLHGMAGFTKCKQDFNKASHYFEMATTARFEPCPYRQNQVLEGLNALRLLKERPDCVLVRPMPHSEEVRKAQDEGKANPEMVRPLTMQELQTKINEENLAPFGTALIPNTAFDELKKRKG